MSAIISGSIDLTKIDKSKLINDKYLNVQISVNENTDQYGNNVGITIGQTKEEREAKSKKTYIGNAKVVWTERHQQICLGQLSGLQSQVDDDLGAAVSVESGVDGNLVDRCRPGYPQVDWSCNPGRGDLVRFLIDSPV